MLCNIKINVMDILRFIKDNKKYGDYPEVAKRTGLSIVHICNMANGKQTLRPDVMEAFIDIINERLMREKAIRKKIADRTQKEERNG